MHSTQPVEIFGNVSTPFGKPNSRVTDHNYVAYSTARRRLIRK